MTHPLSETIEYERYVDGLRRSNAEMLRSIRDIVEFCDDPNGSNKPEGLAMGLSRLLPAARLAIAKATGAASDAAKTIVVHIEGGLVQDVTDIPAGCEVRVEDYDHSDDTQPNWDAEKGCHVTVYGGGGV